jgi:hypothetical protein
MYMYIRKIQHLLTMYGLEMCPFLNTTVFILDTYWYDHDTIGIALEL